MDPHPLSTSAVQRGVTCRTQALALAALFSGASLAHAASVLMISVDGMKPEYVTEAAARHVEAPFLRSLMAEGTYARGVMGVMPTNTYPSHTTLITGQAPAAHGVYNNVEFDPRRKFAESWYWYSQQIQVPTLWQAAHVAGLRTASVGWPVTIGAADIDSLIPEYWRIFHPTPDLNPSDRYLMAALSRPAGLLEHLRPTAGPYLMGNDTSRGADEIKTRFAVTILREQKPQFMTVHLSSFDDAQHEHGPFSAQALDDLTAVDGMLAQMAAAARAVDPAAITLVVSDHGFAPVTHRVNFYIPFIKAGFIQTAPDSDAKSPSITTWTAQPWSAGGTTAIMLNDPADRQTEQRVRELLKGLQADPKNGIAAVLEHDDIARLGGFPQAAFLVLLKLGYYSGGNYTGELITDFAGPHGGHGYSPEVPEMRAAFFIAGPGIAAHRDLGLIDMRQIAPTVAGLLTVALPSATAPGLNVRR